MDLTSLGLQSVFARRGADSVLTRPPRAARGRHTRWRPLGIQGPPGNSVRPAALLAARSAGTLRTCLNSRSPVLPSHSHWWSARRADGPCTLSTVLFCAWPSLSRCEAVVLRLMHRSGTPDAHPVSRASQGEANGLAQVWLADFQALSPHTGPSPQEPPVTRGRGAQAEG